MKTKAIILAAGKGTRMHSDTPKVLHKICGEELIQYPMQAVAGSVDEIILVVGYGADEVKACIGDKVQYVEQKKQQGTGHAVMQAESYIEQDDIIIIVAGDMPLLQAKTIGNLKKEIENEGASAVMLTADVGTDATGYGRVLRRENKIIGVIEERDATEEQKAITEVCTSVYAFRANALKEALHSLKNDNSQGEYYLTDCIAYLAKEGNQIGSLSADKEECLGVNDLVQLAEASKIMQRRINEQWMVQGVQIIDPASTWISPQATLERGAIIYPANIIEGKSVIGAEAILYAGNFIESAVVGATSKIGPNAHLRPKTVLGIGCRVGNFVELKNVTLGDGAKVSHLAYCGDGEIGARANISCGVIFSNYNGAQKACTYVGEDAFVGCNANLVAPVQVGNGAYIGAGSTITEDVPDDALAIARERQTTKENWNWIKRIKSQKNK